MTVHPDPAGNVDSRGRSGAAEAGGKGSPVAVAISAALAETLFDAGSRGRLQALGHPGISAAAADLSVLGAGTVACLTGWDTPPLTDQLLDQCPDLKVLAHTGGSVRHLVPPTVFDRGVVLCQASAVLAEAVAEYTVMAILAGLRRLTEFDRSMRDGVGWDTLAGRPRGRLLRTRTVGLVGASRVGRAVAELLRPFGCRILMHDPYLPPADAARLGVEPAELPDLLAASEVLSLHAPLLPSTTGMIGASQLRLLPDGALVVNTARAGLVDSEPLLAELGSGRLSAVLDVFDTEPLPSDSPWRTLPSGLVTPHIAALTQDTLYAQGAAMLDDIERVLSGVAPRYRIDRAAYDVIA